MKGLHTTLLVVAALLAAYLQAACDLPRHLLGTQIALLPPLVVYAALRKGVPAVCLVSLAGGLGLDTLSVNPLGASVLPLLAAGTALHLKRELVLSGSAFAQFFLGLAAGLLSLTLTLVVVASLGPLPPLGWGAGWQLAMAAVGAACLTPMAFRLFDRLARAVEHPVATEPPFPLNREIKRGRY